MIQLYLPKKKKTDKKPGKVIFETLIALRMFGFLGEEDGYEGP